MSTDIGRFPSFAEIQELREQYKRDPKFTKEINHLILLCLDYNAEGIRKAAHVGLTHYDFEEPLGVHRKLMELQFSKLDFYRVLEKQLRELGYSTILSTSDDDYTYCDLLISW